MASFTQLVRLFLLITLLPTRAVCDEEGGGGGCPEEAALRERVGQLERELGEVKTDYDNARNGWTETEAKLNDNVHGLERTVEELRGRVRELEEQVNNVVKERDGFRADVDKLTNELNEVRGHRTDVEIREQQAKAELDKIKSELDSIKSKHADELDHVKQSVKATAEQLHASQNSLLDVKHDLMVAKEKVQKYEEMTIFQVYKKFMAMIGKDDGEL